MRFSITSEQRAFFYKHNFIEFADIITSDECAKLIKGCDAALFERTSHTDIAKATPKDLYMHGRDLFRESKQIKSFVYQSKLAHLISEFIHTKPIRLLYTQYFRTGENTSVSSFNPLFFAEECRLENISSFQGIIGGLIITLSTNLSDLPHFELSIEEDLTTLSPFCPEKGYGLFFTKDAPLSLAPMFRSKNEAHLLIVYGEKGTVYKRNDDDPHTHYLKKLGYVFGDKLRDNFHPIVYK